MTEPVAAPVRYRYHFTDLLSNRLLATLPLRDAKLSEVINGPAEGSGSLPLTASDVRDQDPFGATIPRRTMIWAERQVLDEEARRIVSRSLPWCGLLVGRGAARSARALDLKFVTWPGYYERRLLPNLPFYGYDSLDVFRGVLDYASSQVPGFTGVTTGGGRVGPVLNYSTRPAFLPRFPTTLLVGDSIAQQYVGRDRRTALEAAQDLASRIGLDWRFVPYLDPASDVFSPRLRLELGRPRLGRVGVPELRWSADRVDNRSRWGYLVDYKLDEDGSDTANRMLGYVGTSSDELSSVATAEGLGSYEVAEGMPLYESSIAPSGNEVTTQAALNAATRAALAASLSSQVRMTDVQVRGDLAPDLTRYSVGDDVTLKADPALHGRELTIVGQVIGRTITPPEQGRTEGVAMDVQGAAA